MPSPIVVTPSSASANSYTTLAEATAYFEDRLAASSWRSADPTQQHQALLMAAKMLDTRIQWKGQKTVYEQAMQWPRSMVEDVLSFPPGGYSATLTGLGYSAGSRAGGYLNSDVIPQFLKDAQCEMALSLLTDATRVDDQNKGLKKMKVDAIELEFDHSNEQEALPRTVREVIEPYTLAFEGDSGGGGTVSLVRT